MESYQPVAYTQPHHQLIEQLLQGFNHEYLGSHNILFGGGTRIALELKEYRTSVDIDFLCANKEAYRAVRRQVTSQSLGELVRREFTYVPEIRFDRYGVRTFLEQNGEQVKLEFVAFDDYQLAKDARNSLFPVPFIDQTSCFTTKLLANADRAGQKPYKDMFDIVAMAAAWGPIPDSSLRTAANHYSEKVVIQGLKKALEGFSDNLERYQEAAGAMNISSDFFESTLQPTAEKLRRSL